MGSRLATLHGGAIHAVHPPGLQAADARLHVAEVLLSSVVRARASHKGEAEQEFDAPSGSLLITPARVDSRVVWPSVRESVIVALTEDALRTLATHEFDTGGVELRPPPPGTVDSWALRIGQLLKAELAQREVPNELYVDSLITLFGVHILRHYSNVRKPPLVIRGGLGASVARRLQDYIENNLSRSLPVAELAGIAGLSVRHFIQAFTRSFGEPPHRYVVDQRLAFAEKLLTRGDLTIAEVAYQSGFSSQSHLTTTMKKHRQKTPLQVRRER
jgi:AraC family transcriptional regulator